MFAENGVAMVRSAFNGTFEMAASLDEALDLRWRNGDEFAHLYVNLRACEHRLNYSRSGRSEQFAIATGS